MARAFSEGTDKHSAEDFAAELERCGATLTRTPTTPASG